MTSVKLHLRPSKKKGQVDGRLFFRLIRNRQAGNLSLPYRIYLSEWDNVNHCITFEGCQPVRLKSLQKIQRIISQEEQSFLTFVAQFEEQDDVPVKEIISIYRNRASFVGLTGFVNSLVEELLYENRHRTALAYQSSWRRLLRYSKKEELTVKDFTEKFIKGFERQLQDEECSLNTISFYMRNLRAMYNKGKDKRIFPQDVVNPFRNVYTKIPVTWKRELNKDDRAKLNDEEQQKSRELNQDEKDALLLFLFSFYACGMSFVDMAHLRKVDIDNNVLSYFRRKTGKLIQMKVSEEMTRIMNYFEARTIDSPYVFPIIRKEGKSAYGQYCSALRQQKMRLKLIKDKLGLEKELSAHLSATIARSESVAKDIISEVLGLSFVSTAYIYPDSFGSNVISLANQKVSQAINRFSDS